MFAERDLLRRLIQDLGRMLAAAIGLRESGKLDEADQELESAIAALLGRLRRDAELLDSRSLAALLALDRLGPYALVLAERANLHEARGEHAAAARDRRRALELLLELEMRGVNTHEAERAGLAARVDVAALDSRYREFHTEG